MKLLKLRVKCKTCHVELYIKQMHIECKKFNQRVQTRTNCLYDFTVITYYVLLVYQLLLIITQLGNQFHILQILQYRHNGVLYCDLRSRNKKKLLNM